MKVLVPKDDSQLEMCSVVMDTTWIPSSVRVLNQGRKTCVLEHVLDGYWEQAGDIAVHRNVVTRVCNLCHGFPALGDARRAPSAHLCHFRPVNDCSVVSCKTPFVYLSDLGIVSRTLLIIEVR